VLIHAPEIPSMISTRGPRQQADAKSADRPPATKALPPPAERSKLSVDFVDMA
jgi:hypothetical protein